MHPVTLTVSAAGHPHVVALPRAEEAGASTEKPPSPIAPELKELVWGGGSFIVLAILVRVFLYPRLKKGMDARHDLIRGELEAAEATRASAEAEVTEYNAELAVVRAEANARIDAARQTLEAERQARLAVVNAEIAERRSAAAAEAEAAKVAARDQVVTAGAEVTAHAAGLVLGQPVDADAARAAVEAAMSAGGPLMVALTGILAAEDPNQTHHPIFPEGSEMLWGTLSFLVVAYLLWKFGWPQIKQMMEARTARIQAQLDEASTAKTEADEAAVAVREAKGDIASERQRLLAEADAQAARLLADGRVRLDQEVADLTAKAEGEVGSVQGRLQGEVQAEVAEVAARATENVVTDALDDAMRQQLVEQFISRVGASS